MNFIKRNIPILITGIALLILFFIIIGLSQTKEPQTPGLSTVTEAELIAAHTYILGSPDAAFSLVMFADLTSANQAAYYQTLQNLYGENSRYLKIALRHMPQNDQAKLRAKAAQAAGEQGKFWEFAEVLYNRVEDELNSKELSKIAEALALSTKEFETDLKDEAFDTVVEMDLKDAKKLELTTPPEFFLNEDKLAVTSPQDLEQQVQAEIDRVKQYRLNRERSQTEDPNGDGVETDAGNPAGGESKPGTNLNARQLKWLQTVKEISFTEEGWNPKEASVVKNQVVRWTNTTEEEIEIEQLDKLYDDFEENKVIAPGETLEFKFTRPGVWRYQEAGSLSWGMVFVENY
ncbi:thioredoxin domain-containing protein [candidate division WWE3 bacterium]|nr:thioredoxin domain-containing protein [candidate division WWE3 bacterium]